MYLKGLECSSRLTQNHGVFKAIRSQARASGFLRVVKTKGCHDLMWATPSGSCLITHVIKYLAQWEAWQGQLSLSSRSLQLRTEKKDT